MIDIHSHIIFGVDDGPKTIEGSLRMLCEAERIGIKVIIATPHYKHDEENFKVVRENYNTLLLKAMDFNITLKLGSEIFIHPLVQIDIMNGMVATLGSSSYVLVEFPNTWIPAYAKCLTYELQLDGITMVIAHPERSKNFSDNTECFKDFFNRGCLFQVDTASILGVYGGRIKKFTQNAIKNNMVHFIASDAHCVDDYSKWYLQSFDAVRKLAGEVAAEKLYFKNAKVIITDSKYNLEEKSSR